MNWSDYVVLGIIAVFGIIGLARGFVSSVFKVAAFFIAIIASVKFYPVAADFLTGTPVYENIKRSILKNLTTGYQSALPVSGRTGGTAVEAVVGRLPLPGFLKQNLAEKIPGPGELFDVQSILGSISDELTKVIISILSLILLFFLIRLALYFIGLILQGLTKLPLLKQMDRLGGLALGMVEGLLMVYIISAVLMLFNSSPRFGQIFSVIDASVLARFFYENNFIINWIIPK